MGTPNAVIFDTNIYIYHSWGYPDAIDIVNQCAKDGMEIIMPSIIISELFSVPLVDEDQTVKKAMEQYVKIAKTADLDEEVALKAGEIRRKWRKATGKKLKTPDSIIAATAIIHDATLYSNNERDFAYLRDNFQLKYFNPIADQEQLNRFIEKYTSVA